MCIIAFVAVTKGNTADHVGKGSIVSFVTQARQEHSQIPCMAILGSWFRFAASSGMDPAWSLQSVNVLVSGRSKYCPVSAGPGHEQYLDRPRILPWFIVVH